ncbi:MAG TPA: sigma-70 family RNA polymerase sigma factor [Acidocella sp.]|nr:sigma-70 family RNA polymerase sigma factor [Acidocella sp.]
MMADELHARFRALALPLLPSMYRLALALTGSRPRAEDLVQETYLRALKYFPSYQGEDFKAWMTAIMRNLHRTQFSAAIPVDNDNEERLAALPDPSPNPEQAMLSADRSQQLRRLIAALPESLREVLVMREFAISPMRRSPPSLLCRPAPSCRAWRGRGKVCVRRGLNMMVP